MICTNSIARQRRLGARFRRIVRRDDGSTLVEMGLGMTVFMAFFFGMIQFCYGLYAYNYVGEAAREASRFAMVRGSQCAQNLNNTTWCSPYSGNTGSTGADASDISTFVQELGFPGMMKNKVSVSTNWYTGTTSAPHSWSTTACTVGGTTTCNAPGNAVNVTVSYPVSIGIPFLPNVAVTVQSTSQMVIVQ